MIALTIGQVASQAGVGVETVRFYEREGLLEEPQRAEDKVEDINGRIRSLQAMKKALVKVSKTCSGKGSIGDCPILRSLQPTNDNS